MRQKLLRLWRRPSTAKTSGTRTCRRWRRKRLGRQRNPRRRQVVADGRGVAQRDLTRAWKQVRANRGAPGVDGVTIEQFPAWYREHGAAVMEMLQEGRYQPSPVRRVDIPKPGGGTRMLGVPTVLDRLIQQAIVLVLTPIFWTDVLVFQLRISTGTQGRHDAVRQVRWKYVAEGHRWVVDLDLSKFFDRVNHDILMERLVEELNRFLRGWLGYFRLAETPSRFEELDGWIRRRLRCFLLSQWKAAAAAVWPL